MSGSPRSTLPSQLRGHVEPDAIRRSVMRPRLPPRRSAAGLRGGKRGRITERRIASGSTCPRSCDGRVDLGDPDIAALGRDIGAGPVGVLLTPVQRVLVL